MSELRISLIGAGSESFGPATIRDILLSDVLHKRVAVVNLMDIDADRVEKAKRYAVSAAERLGRSTQFIATTDLSQALDGANFVVAAIEVQRYLYWSQDFHIPRKYGFRQVYGENGGPGGLFHALRNMGPTLEIARAMERFCPGAPLLNYTNPEQKLCEAVSRLTSIRAYGLCHGVFMGLEQIAAMLGMPVDDLDAPACGINHFTWFQSIRNRHTGEDLYPKLREIEKAGDLLHNWHEIGLGRILFRRFGLWPSPAANHYGEYVRWAEEFVASELQYFYDPADGHPWQTGRIPEFIYSLSGRITERPLQPGGLTPTAPNEPGEEAPLLPSGELAVPIMEALSTGVQRHLDAVVVPNRGAIPNLPDDMTVEVPADADGDGIHPCRMDPLPEGIAALLRVQGSIQKLLVEAYDRKSRDLLMQAVLLDPVVDSYRRAVHMVDEMIELQQSMLPRFNGKDES